MSRRLVLLFLCGYVLENIICDENGNFFLVPKSIPRIGKRGSKGTSDFEKFFLKASKSVPRIGRRNEIPYNNPYEVSERGFKDNQIKYPIWNELAERYEYDPELFSSPEFLAKLENEVADDPTVYEWDKIRMKRNIPDRFMTGTTPKFV